MKFQKIYTKAVFLLGVLFLTAIPVQTVGAEVIGSLTTITGEAQIQPIQDGTGKYLLKSNGFYCLNADGSLEGAPAVHYFEHQEIDGTVLNGYYYHDESGKFKSESPHVVQLAQISCGEIVFDGYYMVNNLGKLSAAPQVRYMDNLVLNNLTFNGYYYFNEYGKMITSAGTYYLDMTSNGQIFDGTYYFGGENGVLVQAAGTTPDGFPVDETGKIGSLENLSIETLRPQLWNMLAEYEGTWSVYVKDLESDKEVAVNSTPLYSASLIKAFVMAKTFENMDAVLEHQAKRLNTTADNPQVQAKVDTLLQNMITVSDNESYNELVRLQSPNHDFLEGAQEVNAYIQAEGYENTVLMSTLHPSASDKLTLDENSHNTTTVEDCGKLLSKIYHGECVSEEASQKMLDLLLNQNNRSKIPTGLPEGIISANKTGETDSDQHDMAIVYGPETAYILCVMSEGFSNGDQAIEHIRSVSRVAYNYLNLGEKSDSPTPVVIKGH